MLDADAYFVRYLAKRFRDCALHFYMQLLDKCTDHWILPRLKRAEISICMSLNVQEDDLRLLCLRKYR